MKNLVKGLLKGQEERRVEIEKGFAVERRSLAEKLSAEFNEAMESLGCKDLIANGEVTVKEVEVIKEVVKEVPVVKEVEVIKEVKIVDEKIVAENKELVEMVAVLERINNAMENELKLMERQQKNDSVLADAKIAALEKEVAKYKKSSETFQSKYATMKNKNKALEDKIAELEAELQEQIIAKPAIKQTEDKKETNNMETNNIETALIKCEKYKTRRTDVTMYDGGNFYVMASTKCQEITVIPKRTSYVVTDDVIKTYQEELVKLGYRENRTNVSPVVVNHKEDVFSGYLARTEAANGVKEFSDMDQLSGYVVDTGRIFLWSWQPKAFSQPAVYELDRAIRGEKITNAKAYDVKRVSGFITKMYEIYMEQVSKITAAKADEIAKATEIAQQKAAEAAKRTAEFNEKVSQAKKSGKVLGKRKGGDNKEDKGNKNYSNSLKEAMGSF